MISSLSGLAGLAGDVPYSASKFALEGATEALRHEIDRWGIHVALVEAGQYATELFRDEGELPAGYPADSPYRALVAAKLKEVHDGHANAMSPDLVGQLLPQIADSDGSQLRWPADDVARHVLHSLHRHSDAERDAFLRGAGKRTKFQVFKTISCACAMPARKSSPPPLPDPAVRPAAAHLWPPGPDGTRRR